VLDLKLTLRTYARISSEATHSNTCGKKCIQGGTRGRDEPA
jgi:hypothetical protein